MTVRTLTIGKRSFVLVDQKAFVRLRRDSERYRKLQEEDRALGKLAMRRLRAFRRGGSKGAPL
jgi:hypothetical protein